MLKNHVLRQPAALRLLSLLKVAITGLLFSITQNELTHKTCFYNDIFPRVYITS